MNYFLNIKYIFYYVIIIIKKVNHNINSPLNYSNTYKIFEFDFFYPYNYIVSSNIIYKRHIYLFI